jgi:hypothetical protein
MSVNFEILHTMMQNAYQIPLQLHVKSGYIKPLQTEIRFLATNYKYIPQ